MAVLNFLVEHRGGLCVRSSSWRRLELAGDRPRREFRNAPFAAAMDRFKTRT